MSGTFTSFFLSGWQHIADIHAYDHLLFVMTLCAAFKLNQWKQVLVIITAFTIGHSVTLILSSFGYIPSNTALIDMTIPFTIMITAISNIINKESDKNKKNRNIKYLIALTFGLIHGLAFASNFKVMMFGNNIIYPLFSFNLGIEAGQIFIVCLFMIGLYIYNYFKGDHSKWNIFVSGAGFGIAATIFIEAISNYSQIR